MADAPVDAEAQRKKAIEARQAALRERMPRREPIRVIPRDDEVRKFLKHPRGTPFPASGSVEWPHDRFTRRRLLDGSVKREESAKHPGPAPHRASHA